jgi:hypothetical protein
MQASRIAPIKKLIRTVDLGALAPRVQAAVEGGNLPIRNQMLSIARDFGLTI